MWPYTDEEVDFLSRQKEEKPKQKKLRMFKEIWMAC